MDPIELEKALNILIKHIAIGAPSYHKDYDRVVGLASLYKKLITGEDIDSLLVRYNPRESIKQFKQRKRITQLVTPAVCEKIKTPFYKVARIDNVKKGIIFEDTETDANNKKVKEIEEVKRTFFGDESLDEYMESIFIDQSFSDPNSFLLQETNTVTGEAKAKPFPIMVPSHKAVNFKYVNNILQYLVVQTAITLKSVEGTRKGLELRIYTPEFNVKIREVEDQRKEFADIDLDIEQLESTKKATITIKKQKYNVTLIESGTEGTIQAVRIGYKRDDITNKRTFVSPLHSALNRMMKSVKATSEMDLTMTLHVHPQKAEYAPRCPGVKPDICNTGLDRNGHSCKACKGTGFVLSTSSQEMLKLPLPKDKNDMIDLDKLISYKSPPIELVKWMDDFVKQLEIQSMQDVFTSESFNRIVAPKTLGEKELDMESVYDTLFPFANNYSKVWRKECTLIAIFTDNGSKVVVIHEFPRDFKLKTAKALIADREAAKNAQVPAYLLQEIDNDLAVKLYANNDMALMQYQTKQQHIPFKGKSDAQIQISINMNLTPQFDKVLWSNFDAIFQDLEAEFMTQKVGFYDLPYDKRVEAIETKTNSYMLLIAGGSATSTLFGTGIIDEDLDIEGGGDIEGDEIDTPVDVEAAAKAKLKGTVGGVTALLAVNKAVSDGSMSMEAAIELLGQIFGFDEPTARKLLKQATTRKLP